MKKNSLFLMVVLMVMTVMPVGGYTLKRVSVHDPSVVWEPSTQYYYIFGSHRGVARSKDMMNWSSTSASWGRITDAGTTISGVTNDKAFVTNMTKTVTVGGEERQLVFDAQAWSSAYGNYSINGNMWAPDVIYNPTMQKWCMYLSINGPQWNSSIILLTSDKITGPYVYQGPVVISGFNVSGSPASLSYKNTDLELAIGTQNTIPSRYTAYWGRRWPHAIDPCVFYDEEGRLWMSYGSWSGGIWILELNEETGLRDYDVKYPSTNGSSDGVTSDPYFGKKIAGGYYVSGEGSYIEYINGYYYLFMSYGFMLSAENGSDDQKNQGGYQMRVFRSQNPNGPYVDNRNGNAIFTSYQMNYGPNDTSHRGINIFGAYSQWGNMTLGEREQGHNSIIAAEDGRTYLVYHTRFQDNTQGHAIRVHQVFQNQDGWLVVAPFEFTGETVKSADIATTQQVATDQIPGTYKLLVHKYGLKYTWGNQETVTPVDITLKADGTISGALTGKWEVVDGTSYINVTLGSIQYKGVMVEQVMEPNTDQNSITFTRNATNTTVAFTALAKSGVTAWAYRSGDDPTAIDDALHLNDNEKMHHDKWFDLQGRRIAAPSRKGIYIRGNKKIIR